VLTAVYAIVEGICIAVVRTGRNLVYPCPTNLSIARAEAARVDAADMVRVVNSCVDTSACIRTGGGITVSEGLASRNWDLGGALVCQ
jgi:hypothetical protein